MATPANHPQKNFGTPQGVATVDAAGKNGKSMPAVPVFFNTTVILLKKAGEEELLKNNPLQLITNPIQNAAAHEDEELPAQMKPFQLQTANTEISVPNQTGMPDNLKAGVEALSGIAMDDVKVHYNSGKPAQLQALAYAQGTDIHIAPGQEKHLPHEAWHVVQQKQGRVQPTLQMKEGVAVNDDKGLESEADVMGKKAAQPKAYSQSPGHWAKAETQTSKIVQRVIVDENEQPVIWGSEIEGKVQELKDMVLKKKILRLHNIAERIKVKGYDDLEARINNGEFDNHFKNIGFENGDKEAKEFLAGLKGVRIGFDEGINFGNIASGLTLIQSLRELGFKGGVTLVCPDTIIDKLKILKPDIEEVITHEKTDAFSADKPVGYTPPADDKVISFLTNGDLIDDKTNLSVLNYMKTDTCLILNPYGWNHTGLRKLIQRDTNVKDKAAATEMNEAVNREALYAYSLAKPENLIEYLKTEMKVLPAKADGIIAVAESVEKRSILLQPVYGLHTLNKAELVNTEATLAEGVKQALLNKPVVLLMLSNSRVDYIPPYTKEWLIRATITDKDLSQKITSMNGDKNVMIVDCGGLPNTVFTQIFKMASLPPLIEGANTSNLMQLIGKPWMSARTNTTEFPFKEEENSKNAIKILHELRDALTSKSNMHTALSNNQEQHDAVEAGELILTNISTWEKWAEAGEFVDLETSLNQNKKRIDYFNNKDITAEFSAIIEKSKQQNKQITGHTEKLAGLIFPLVAELKERLKSSLKDVDFKLDEKNIKAVSLMITQSDHAGSDLHKYFSHIAETAKSGERNQVLQAIIMLLDSNSPAKN